MSKESEPHERPPSGDPDTFQQIVETQRERIYRVALAMTGDRAEAEDVTQEVFLSAYRARASFRGGSAVGTWLYRIAVNAGLDHLARRRTVRWDLEDEAKQTGMQARSADDPEESAEASLLDARIKQAMRRLSPRERAVFALRHYEDLPLKEVASTLSVRVGTVKSLLYRAVVKLQRELSCYREE